MSFLHFIFDSFTVPLPCFIALFAEHLLESVTGTELVYSFTKPISSDAFTCNNI